MKVGDSVWIVREGYGPWTMPIQGVIIQRGPKESLVDLAGFGKQKRENSKVYVSCAGAWDAIAESFRQEAAQHLANAGIAKERAQKAAAEATKAMQAETRAAGGKA